MSWFSKKVPIQKESNSLEGKTAEWRGSNYIYNLCPITWDKGLQIHAFTNSQTAMFAEHVHAKGTNNAT